MDKLLNPDFGLSFWTILVFFLLLWILAKTTWRPLIKALEEREQGIRAEREAAEAARKAAEELKADLERQLAGISAKMQEALAQAGLDGQKIKDDIMKSAHDEAQALAEKTRKALEDDKERLVRELRAQVSDLSVMAAEKILRKSVDAGAQKRLLDDFFKELDAAPKAS